MTNPRDKVELWGMNSQDPVTLLTDGSITYDANEVNGHALAGVGAVTFVGSKQVGLTPDDGSVDGVLLAVEPDGKAVCQFAGFLQFREGATGGLVVGNQFVGDTVAGLVKNLAVAVVGNKGKIVSVDDPVSGDAIALF